MSLPPTPQTARPPGGLHRAARQGLRLLCTQHSVGLGTGISGHLNREGGRGRGPLLTASLLNLGS